MKNRIGCMGILAVTSITLLTGCGSKLPTMTNEEEEMIGEYAAELLLKYDINHRSRLVNLDMIEDLPQDKPTEEIIPSSENNEKNENPENLPITTEESNSTEENNSSISIEQQLALPNGVIVAYQGEEVMSSYSSEGEGDYLSLDATEGKSLLILKFRLENQSQETANIDIFSQKKDFAVTVNGNITRYALTTLLLDDLSCYMEELPAGEGANTVLIVELDETTAANITSISLSIQGEDGNTFLSLK